MPQTQLFMGTNRYIDTIIKKGFRLSPNNKLKSRKLFLHLPVSKYKFPFFYLRLSFSLSLFFLSPLSQNSFLSLFLYVNKWSM